MATDSTAPTAEQVSPAPEGEVTGPPPKPLLRGWLHLGMFPISLVAGAVLVLVVADGTTARVSSAIFALAAAVLFGFSALYHRGTWAPGTLAVLRCIDIAIILLMIAGTYTPLSLTMLSGTSGVVVLTVVWVGALAGMVFRVVWLSAPRWLYTPFYIALGWVAVGVLPQMWSESPPVAALLIAGGLAYSLGGVVYGLRRPDPAPLAFGYHEVFHSCTLVGYTCHYVAAALAVS